MGELQNKLGERAAEGREGLREIGHTVKEAATEGIQRFKETAGERMERGKEKLMDLEHARLLLRRSHGLAVDRGRVVREAISIALADFEINGDDSVIVQRLRDA